MAYYRCEECGTYSKSEDDNANILQFALNSASLPDWGMSGQSWWGEGVYYDVDCSFLRDHYSHLDQITIQEHEHCGQILL